MSDVQTIRAEIDREIEGKTVLDLFKQTAFVYGHRPALSWRDAETWQTITWRQYAQRAAEIGAGLRALGAGHGDFVAIMARNRPEHVIADAGAMHAAATPVSIYNTLAPDQIAYIASNCGAKVAILENRGFAKRWEEIRAKLPALQHIVLMEDADDFRYLPNVLSWEELAARGRDAIEKDPTLGERAAAELRPEDPATLVYTSGTTGPPKGVIITHRNVRWTLESVFRHLPIHDGFRGLSYLPLAHVAERATTYYAGIYRGGHTFFCPEVSEAIEVAGVARPEVFLGVPRVWEKVRAGILAGLEAEKSPLRKALALRAIETGRQVVRLEQAGKRVPPWLRAAQVVLDRLVCAKIRHKIGLDQARHVLTGSAPTSRDVHEFFHGIGLRLLDTWGMTELTVVAAINPTARPRIDTVGVPIPGVEITIADDGEILCRGGVVTAGYLGRPEETAETYDRDGWVHSGDLGALDPDGHLRIVGRKKEILITAGGKNISPANVEAHLGEHPLVGQACLVGDAKPYCAALVVLDGEVAPAWAKQSGIPFTDVATFSRDERVVAEVQRAVDEVNRKVAKVESIKRFAILPTEWTVDSGELTPTLKLKRNVVHQRYSSEIEKLYA